MATSPTTIMMPNSTICFNFAHDGQRLRKSSWLVPHIIRHRDDADVISWRCNWGHVCDSDCFYAKAKGGGTAPDARLEHGSANTTGTEPVPTP